jgi:cytochrome c oxidase cbb3-type subunit 3
MSFACARYLSLVVVTALVLSACEREQRDFHSSNAGNPPGDHYQRDAYDVAQGKRLFAWMNCAGCHSHGGGGMGPALMDDRWIYGGKIQQIYSSIRDGRPNGMPSWKHRMTDQEMWQVAAYVRSMGRYVRKDVATSRDDALQSGEAESRRDRTSAIVQSTPP